MCSMQMHSSKGTTVVASAAAGEARGEVVVHAVEERGEGEGEGMLGLMEKSNDQGNTQG